MGKILLCINTFSVTDKILLCINTFIIIRNSLSSHVTTRTKKITSIQLWTDFTKPVVRILVVLRLPKF